MRRLLIGLLLLPGLSWGEETFSLPRFTDGLYTRYSANATPAGALSESLNVLIDEDADGIVVARHGYNKYNATAITNTKSVRGLWPFDASDGTKYMVAFSSAAFYKTTGDGSWTAITGASGYSSSKDFDCVQTIGKLWCANGDTVFWWDGTSTATVSGAPLGNLIDRFRNRVLISGITGSKGRVRGSAELDGTDYAVQTGVPLISSTPISIAFGGADDGEEITCLMGVYQDVFIVGKRNSLWGLYGFDRTNFGVRELSREVGCIEDRSVREKNNCLYWLSLRGVEKFCGASIERVSDPIRDNIDTIVSISGNPRSAVDNFQADFQAGNLTASGAGAPISATQLPGNIMPSSVTRIDTTDADFNAGANYWVSTGIVPGFLVTAPSNTAAIIDNFSDENLTANPVWTLDQSYWQAGRVTIANDSLGKTLACRANPDDTYNEPTFQNGMRVTAGIAHGVWSASIYSGLNSGNASSNLFIFQFLYDSSGAGYLLRGERTATTGAYRFVLAKTPGNNTSTEIAANSVTLDYGNIGEFKVSRSTNGIFTTYFNGVFSSSGTDTTYAPFNPQMLISIGGVNQGCSDPIVGVSTISASVYASTGHAVSQVFDMVLSTPVGGTFSVSSNVPAGTTLDFAIRSAAGPTGPWGAWSNIENGERIPEVKRYWQYVSSFTTSIGTQTAAIGDVTLIGATTGYFIGQCRNPSTNITSWGSLSCNIVANSGGVSVAIATGSTCDSVGRATAPWTSLPNNGPISVATAPFVAYRLLFDIDSGTEAPTVQDCTINWREGASRPPVSSAIYRDRYYLAYTSSTASGTVNDHLLVLDKNDKWTLFDHHNCYSMSLYERGLYCGSSTDAGQIWKLDSGTDDDGAAILSRIRTRAFDFGSPERRKTFSRMYLDMEPAPDASSNIDLTARYTIDRGTTTHTFGDVDLAEDLGHVMTPKFPFPLTEPVSARYLQIELESNGRNSPWRLYGGRIYSTSLRTE